MLRSSLVARAPNGRRHLGMGNEPARSGPAPIRFCALALAVLGALSASCTTPRDGFESANDKFGSDEHLDADAASTSCASSATTIERVPVVMEFLVDESVSMRDLNKWKAAREALLAMFADMRADADQATFVGVYLYPKNDKIPPRTLFDAAHYDDVVRAVNVGSPSGSHTPTAAALESAYRIVDEFRPPTDAGFFSEETKRVVVLFSDGRPTDGPERCQRLAAASFNAVPPKDPIRTFAIGIGPFPQGGAGYDPVFMSRLAQNGGTARAGCDPRSTDPMGVCHYQITPGADVAATTDALTAAFDEIRALSASCEFHFKTNPFTDLRDVTVTVTDRDGNVVTIPKDDVDGWSFDEPANPSKIVLRGRSCSVTTGAPSGRVDVVIGCRPPS